MRASHRRLRGIEAAAIATGCVAMLHALGCDVDSMPTPERMTAERSVMHDIKWIRDNPEAFDAALTRRGLSGEAKRLIAIDERRRAAIQTSEAALARRNAASREIGAAKKSNEEAARADADGRGREAQGRHPAAGGRGEGGGRGARQGARRHSRTCRSTRCPTAPTRPAMSSIIISGRTARTTPSRPSSISNWARRSARWISRPRRNSPARASWCSRAGSRAGARDRAVHARRAHARSRLHGGVAAAAGARRGDVRHGAIAEIRRRSVPGDAHHHARRDAARRPQIRERAGPAGIPRRQDRSGDAGRADAAARADQGRLLAHPHRRSPAHQSRARIHRRRGRAADAATPPARRASAPRPAPPARTPAA